MNHTRMMLLSLSALFGLSSCGSNQTTAQLEISSAFVSTDPYGGGFIVIGENTNGKRFSMAINGTNQGKVLLEPGTWNFSAIGWDGGTGNKPFEGNAHCGLASNLSLSDSSATVKISINAANCSSAEFQSFAQFKNLVNVYGCDAFYSYNGNSDTFSPITSSFSTNFCSNSNMVSDYINKFKKYRIAALSISGNSVAPGFSSDCKNMDDLTMDLKLPTSQFPFLISVYKTTEDCSNQVAAQRYMFPNGLQAGNPGFDSLFNPTAEVLLLATSKTKRGKSPFMREIPRINCGSSGSFTDCVSEPALSAHVNVPYLNFSHREQVILKDIGPLIKTCSPLTVMSNSRYFDTEECTVEDRSVFVKPFRNALSCYNSATFFSGGRTIADIHRKGTRVYVLMDEGGNDRIIVYTDKGNELYSFQIGYSATRLAASSTGSVIVTHDGSSARVHAASGSTLSAPSGTYTAAGSGIEVSDDGQNFFVNSTTTVTSYSSVDGSVLSTKSYSGTILDMNMRESYLYVLEADTTPRLQKMSHSTGLLSNPVLVTTQPNAQKFEIVNGSILYSLSGGQFLWNGNTYSTVISSPVAISAVKGMPVIADATTIKTYSGSTDISDTDGSCSEGLTVSIGGLTKTIALQTKEISGIDVLFSEAFHFMGKRFFTNSEHPFYYFESLSHSENNNSGGDLRKVQEMLGPQAIGAFFSDFAQCSDLKTAAQLRGGSFTRDMIYFDETTNESMNFTVSVSTTSESISTYICESTPGTCGVGSQYDLVLSFASSKPDRNEKMKFKLKCNSQIGTLESYEQEFAPNNSVRKELVVYHTESDDDARYEKYQLEEDSLLRATVTNLYKSAPGSVALRRVEFESTSAGLNKRSRVTEFQRSASEIMTSSFELDSVDLADIGTTAIDGSVTVSMVRDNSGFADAAASQNARACMVSNQTLLTAANVTSCYFNTFSTTSLSRGGLNLLPTDYMTLQNSSHPLRDSSSGVFEITP